VLVNIGRSTSLVELYEKWVEESVNETNSKKFSVNDPLPQFDFYKFRYLPNHEPGDAEDAQMEKGLR
jgi:hypothetical protein